MFSLRLKLILYTLFIILFAILTIGYIYNKGLEKDYLTDLQTQFKESFRDLANDLKNTEKNILNATHLIAKNEEIIASMSLIKEYEDIDNYNAILFDEEKKRILNILTLKSKYSPSDYTSMYDISGNLIASVKNIKDSHISYYLSYENTHKVYYSKSAKELLYKKSTLPKGIKTKLDISHNYLIAHPVQSAGVIYELDNKILKLRHEHAIFRQTSNGEKELLGYIEISKNFTQRKLVNPISSKMIVSYYKNNSEKINLSVDNAPLLFSQFDSDELYIDEEEETFFTLTQLPLNLSSLVVKIQTSKKNFEATLLENKQNLLLIMFAVMLITVTLSLSVLNTMISIPLTKLLKGIETISTGEYNHKIDIKSKDELGLISSQFNKMADEISKREVELDNLARYDSLTKIPNRTMFMETLEKAISRAKRLNTKLAVLFLDLDDFKSINDSLGHDVGDELLVQVSKNLSKTMRESDTISRIGGDEFNILIENLDSIDDINSVAEKFIQQMKLPIRVESHQILITGSLGISIYPDDANDSAALLKNADLAMYRAKDNGRNQYCFFSKELEVSLNSRIKMLRELKNAVQKDELKLFYQPKFSLKDGSIHSAEALIRWESSKLGFITPDKFIPLAEQSGEIVQIGAWVIEQACKDFASWQKQGFNIKQVSINVSNVQFTSDDIAKVLSDAITKHAIPPNALEVEITESYMQEDSEKALETLHKIRNLKVDLAIDDFGTGYSSMSYLKKLPITRLKIDQSFIDDIPQNSDDIEITKIIVSLAKIMGLQTTAEGIETLEQLHLLQELDVDEGQGYICSKPLPFEQFKELLKKNNSCIS